MNETANHYRAPGWFTRNVFNRMVARLTRMGVSVLGSRVLETRGRQSGLPRRTPVNLLTMGGHEYLVSPRGNGQWVRNVRADDGRLTLILGRNRKAYVARELATDDALTAWEPVPDRQPNATVDEWHDCDEAMRTEPRVVAALAARLGGPVVSTFMGRGLLSGHDDLVRGTYLGAAGQRAVTELVEGADALLLLGVILSDTNFAVSERKIDMRRAMLAINRSVRVGHHVYPDIPMDALVDALLACAPAGPVRSVVSMPPETYPHNLPADDVPIAPSDIAAAINDLFARHAPMPIAADMGDCLFTAMEIRNTNLVAPGYYAGMGYGVPAGLGACVAAGERPLILVGDGAFQMTGWELGNCRRYGWDPIVIVFNNASWEMLRVFQPESAFNDLDDWRFAELAGPLGGDGVRVRTRAELAASLERAHATRGRFQLIEVMLPRGQTSDTLARFVAGFKAARDTAG